MTSGLNVRLSGCYYGQNSAQKGENAVKATDVLRTEHKAIKRMLAILNYTADRLELKEDIEPVILEKGVDFVRNFADRCHHGKEEGLLFPLLEKKGFARDSGPIGQMLIEHDEGRSYIKGLDAALRKYARGDKTAVQDIVDNVRGYTGLLSRHIDKEDMILFNMADRVLSPDEDASLKAKFDEVESKEIGEGVHEAYHRMLDEFEAAMNLPTQALECAESNRPGCLAFVDNVDQAIEDVTRELKNN